MRNRKSILVIATSSNGTILRCNTDLPKKNTYPKQEKDSYPIANREKYREFSKNVAVKVKAFRQLQSRNRELELLNRKHNARVIADSLNKVILNTKEE